METVSLYPEGEHDWQKRSDIRRSYLALRVGSQLTNNVISQIIKNS